MLESLFNKLAGLKACKFIKTRLYHRCFPVKFAKFLKTPSFAEYLRWLPSIYCRASPLVNTAIGEKFNFNFFKNLSLVLTRFSVWEEIWTLGYNSMKLNLQKQPTEVLKIKKVFWKTSQNSQETSVQGLFFNKVAGLRPATLLKIDSASGLQLY